MPKFSAAIDTQRIPVKGLTPETSATAPSTPVVGQLWVDTSVTPRVLRVWDGSVWAPVNVYAGTTATSYVAGNDTRVVNAEQITNKGVANGYAALDGTSKVAIANIPTGTGAGTVATGDDARITGAAQKSANLADLVNAATARTNLGLGTAATLNTGTGAGNVILGNDARLTDTRTPTDNSVTAAKIVDGSVGDAEIAAALKDGAAGTATMRTLGTGATQALPGNTRLDQLGAAAAAIDANGQRITNVGAPVANTDVARLADIQGAAAGIDAKPSVRVRSGVNVSVTAAPATIDGVTMAAGDRVLLTNQTTATENDIWVYGAPGGAMTRSTDTITPNSFVFVEEGGSGDTQWVVTNNGTITRGTTTIIWTQFGAATAYAGTGNRITVTGTTIDIAATYAGQTSITTLGTITTGTWNGTAVAVAFGGTGATTAAAARTNLGVARAGFAADVPAITAGTAVTVTHGLGTQDVLVQVREVATQAVIELDITNTSTTQVSLRSDVAYAANALRVVVIPVA